VATSSSRSWFFGRTRALTRQIDEYLDSITQGAIVFHRGVDKYLREDEQGFQAKLAQLAELEHTGDSLKRRIQTEIYSEMLIPESRGDVLHLIWHLDEVLDNLKRKLQTLDLTRPRFPSVWHEDLLELVVAVKDTIDATVRGARAYFRDVRSVRDHVQQAIFFESESDRVEHRLLHAIYGSDLPPFDKAALREAVEDTSYIANLAEDAADHLLIYAIKRTI